METSNSPYVYRILSFKHLVDIFESEELYFARPASWDDPYEKILVHNKLHAFFAQCWCKKPVSDAMWRIYSSDHTAVRIRTTRAKLINALRKASDSGKFGYLVKDVEYVRANQIDSQISKIATDLRQNFTSRRAADSLLIKRDAFNHEDEVRVILNDKDAADGSKSKTFFRVPIDPHLLIESVFFDPRVDDTFQRICTYYLKEAISFKQPIRKSALYQTREQVVVD